MLKLGESEDTGACNEDFRKNFSKKNSRYNFTISEIQMEFMPGKSAVDAIFAVKQLVKK